MEPFDFDFASRQPAAPLDRFVEQLWFARGTVPYAREKIAPTGSSVAVFVLGDPIIETPDDGHGTPLTTSRGFLIGPHDRPVINEPTGETYAYGIVTTPVGCGTVFGVAPKSIRGAVVELENAWSAAPKLRAQLLDAADGDAGLNVLETTLMQHTTAVPPGLDRIEQVVSELETDPLRPVADIAAQAGVTHAYLDRQFAQIVGLTPRRFSRLVRMRRLLQQLDVSHGVPWADVAAQLGWFDQSHLIRDFKHHTGVTPTQYLAAQRSINSSVSDADAAGFVPELADTRDHR